VLTALPPTARLRRAAPETCLHSWKTRRKRSKDFGASEKFQRMDKSRQWGAFKGQVDRWLRMKGCPSADAFARLKETATDFLDARHFEF